MATKKRGYLMAMLTGVTIIGAATAGVAAAQTSQNVDQAAASSPSAEAPAAPPTMTPPSTTASPAKPTGTTSTAPSAEASAPPPAAVTTAAPAAPSIAPVPTVFKDGQYSATASYNSPGGLQSLGVTVTVTGDKVTMSTLDLMGKIGISITYQKLFESGYLDQVVGKDLATISLGAVAGSSLTALGFNDALSQIQTAAHA